jgi:hypothetical protein
MNFQESLALIEVLARGGEKETDSDMLFDDDCLFFISSLIHFPIGSFFSPVQ